MCQMSIVASIPKLTDCEHSDINIWSKKGKIPISKSHQPRFVFPFLILLYTQMSKMSCSSLSFWCPAYERVCLKLCLQLPLRNRPASFSSAGLRACWILRPTVDALLNVPSHLSRWRCQLPSFCHQLGCRHGQSCSSSQKVVSSPWLPHTVWWNSSFPVFLLKIVAQCFDQQESMPVSHSNCMYHRLTFSQLKVYWQFSV